MEREQILELRTEIQKFIRLFGLLDQSVTPCGFSLSPSQVFALQELEESTVTIGELSDRLFLDRSSVSRLIDALVKGGFVIREINEENRREVLVSLSEKGVRSLHQVSEQSIEFYKSILNFIKEEDQEKILQGFQKFTNALANVRR